MLKKTRGEEVKKGKSSDLPMKFNFDGKEETEKFLTLNTYLYNN